MRRSFIVSIALMAMAFMGVAAPPAFAQAAVSLTGYVDSTGHKAVARESTPLPTLVQPFVVPASRFNYAGATGGIVNTTAVPIAAAAGAGIRNYVAALQYFNSAAVASEIEIRDGVTVIFRGYVPASMTVPVQIVFPVPLRGSANTAMNVALGTTATATRVSAQGYVSPN